MKNTSEMVMYIHVHVQVYNSRAELSRSARVIEENITEDMDTYFAMQK